MNELELERCYTLDSYSKSARRAYVTEQLSTIIGKPVSPSDAQVAQAWALLSRQEERGAPRDRHGNFPCGESVLERLGLLEHPPLDEVIQALAGRERIVCWPRPYRFAACLTHDVDVLVPFPWRERLRRLRDPRLTVLPRQRLRWAVGAVQYAFGLLGGHSERSPFDTWMAEEARHGFHSTFFAMPEEYLQPTHRDHYHRYTDPVRYFSTRMTYAEAMRLARAAGWEIGLHGSYASAYNGEMLLSEKSGLEAMLGAPVRSGRQHYLRFDIDVTPQAWAHAGLRADTTMGYCKQVGYRSGISFPYFWPGEGDVLEAPLSLHDISLFRLDGQRVNPDIQLARVRAMLTRVANIGGIVTLSWHTHPDYPNAVAYYRDILAMVAELGGWGCTLGALNAWWRLRRASVRIQQREHAIQEVDNAA